MDLPSWSKKSLQPFSPSLVSSLSQAGYTFTLLDSSLGCHSLVSHGFVLVVKKVWPTLVSQLHSSPNLKLLHHLDQVYFRWGTRNEKGCWGWCFCFSLHLFSTLLLSPSLIPKVGNLGEERELRRQKDFHSTFTIIIWNWCSLGMADGELTFSLVGSLYGLLENSALLESPKSIFLMLITNSLLPSQSCCYGPIIHLEQPSWVESLLRQTPNSSLPWSLPLAHECVS